jgi:hypothetical protein
MGNEIIRPTFYEGMILGADNLNGTVDHARNERARHNRHLHSWGIAHGLTLTKEDQSADGENYVSITLQPGMAVDGTGREIIIPVAELLVPETFAASGVSQGAEPGAWFPVFVVGLDKEAIPSGSPIGACDTGEPSSIEEGFQIEFGRPGDVQQIDEQTVPQISKGPGSSNGQTPWRVLIGFVKWSEDVAGGKFVDAKERPDSIPKWQLPRYTGVRADEVIARSDLLTLRSAERQMKNKPVIEIDGTEEGEFRFGLQNDRGVLQKPPLLSVDAQGNLTVQGALKGEVTAGNVFVQSGIATDGLVIPLPFGITQKQVDDGQIDIHIHISIQIDSNLLDPPDQTNEWIAISKTAEVDDIERKVTCSILWLQLNTAAGSALNYEEGPGICKYIIIASVSL